ncbi:MAG: hypothetical protein NZ990_10185 [Myxococcota bacterium]|nr:hypothetical protein [Myxococcota bacterium]
MNARSGAACILAFAAGIAIGYAVARETGAGKSAPVRVAAALQEQDLLARTGMLAAALEDLEPGNLEDALAALSDHRVGVTDQELRVFMLGWARFDAAGAFEWAAARGGAWGRRLQEAAAYAWGFTNPQAALEVLETVPTEQRRRREGSPLMSALMDGWRVNGDLPGITAQLISMPPSRQRESLTTAVLAEIKKQGLDPAIAWVDAIPLDAAGGYKRLAFNRAAGVVAHADVERAAQWYLAHQGQPYTEKSLPVIARRWIDHHEPSTLFPWLAQLPAPVGQEVDPEQSLAISQGMKWWLRRDPDAAQAWINAMEPVPEVYDPALGSLAQFYLKSNADLAAHWALQVRDEELRTEILVRAMRRWTKKDPEAAAEWLATADISSEARERIRKTGSTGRSAGGSPAGGRRGRPR